MNKKPFLKSRTVRYNLALAGVSIVGILTYILSVIGDPSFADNVVKLLNAFGLTTDTTIVLAVVGLIQSAINLYLRIITDTGVSLK